MLLRCGSSFDFDRARMGRLACVVASLMGLLFTSTCRGQEKASTSNSLTEKNAMLAPWTGPFGGVPPWHLMAGQYEYTPDHRPLLGPTALPGLHVNTGYSGHGVMCSAGGARRVVDLLVGRSAVADEPFRMDRPFLHRAHDVL